MPHSKLPAPEHSCSKCRNSTKKVIGRFPQVTVCRFYNEPCYAITNAAHGQEQLVQMRAKARNCPHFKLLEV